MKVRKGLVSNSSSSSFVVALKAGFRITEEMVQALHDEGDDDLAEFFDDVGGVPEVTDHLNAIISDAGFWKYGYSEEEGETFIALQCVLSDFVVATLSVGSDEGVIIPIDSKKALDILKE